MRFWTLGPYFFKKLMFAIITVWLAITADFALPRLMGGNPALALASKTALGSPAVVKALERAFGLYHTSVLQQYGDFIVQMLHGNLGISYEYYPESVTQVVFSALPYTVGLVLSATVLSFLLGTLLGVVAAWHQGRRVDDWSVGVAFIFFAIPYFWLAMLLVYVFAFLLGWLPMGQALPVSVVPLPPLALGLGIIRHAVLPVASLVLATAASYLLIMRDNMLSVLAEDYMMLARAKGVPNRRLMFRYAARAALLPSFTQLMLSLGSVVGGALVTEVVFSYPGLGNLIYNAILNHDYPVIQGAFLILALSVISANFVADLLYPLLDPRVMLN